MSTTTDKPVVDLNLDSLAKEAHSEPYHVVLGGKRFVLVHAGVLDAFELFDAMSKPEPHATLAVLGLALGKDGMVALRGAHPSFEQMQATIKGYFAHSGLAVPED